MDHVTVIEAIGDLVERRGVVKAQQSPLRDGVIYYLQVGDMVKIGTTINLARRLADYPPNRLLLATEPGGLELEQQRHQQFKAECISGEWFRPSIALLAHIEELCCEHGVPDRVA